MISEIMFPSLVRMEREMESLRTKFEVEKAKLHAQFVAEQSAGYATVGVTD